MSRHKNDSLDFKDSYIYKDLVLIANRLDSLGLYSEADTIDNFIKNSIYIEDPLEPFPRETIRDSEPHEILDWDNIFEAYSDPRRYRSGYSGVSGPIPEPPEWSLRGTPLEEPRKPIEPSSRSLTYHSKGGLGAAPKFGEQVLEPIKKYLFDCRNYLEQEGLDDNKLPTKDYYDYIDQLQAKLKSDKYINLWAKRLAIHIAMFTDSENYGGFSTRLSLDSLKQIVDSYISSINKAEDRFSPNLSLLGKLLVSNYHKTRKEREAEEKMPVSPEGLILE